MRQLTTKGDCDMDTNKIDFSSLPKAVQNALLAQAANSASVDIDAKLGDLLTKAKEVQAGALERGKVQDERTSGFWQTLVDIFTKTREEKLNPELVAFRLDFVLGDLSESKEAAAATLKSYRSRIKRMLKLEASGQFDTTMQKAGVTIDEGSITYSDTGKVMKTWKDNTSTADDKLIQAERGQLNDLIQTAYKGRAARKATDKHAASSQVLRIGGKDDKANAAATVSLLRKLKTMVEAVIHEANITAVTDTQVDVVAQTQGDNMADVVSKAA